MKTQKIIFYHCLQLILLSIPLFGFPQNNYSGKWEGYFMNDFRTLIEIGTNNNSLSGKILMYNGKDLIQNDKLTQIKIEETKLGFYIAEKQTEFFGEFKDTENKLVGNFIFPDGSKHPINLTRLKLQAGPDSLVASMDLNRKLNFSMDELLADFDFLVKAIKTNHPLPNLYISQSNLDQLIQSVRSEINTDLSLPEFFKLIAPVSEAIKCSHTGIRLPKDYIDSLSKCEAFFPLRIMFENRRCYVIQNPYKDNQQLTPGIEILSINKKPMDQIYNDLVKFIPSEGVNKTTKQFELNRNFNFLYGTLDPSDSFQVRYSTGDFMGKTRIKAIALADIENYINENPRVNPILYSTDSSKMMGTLRLETFHFADVNAYIKKMDSIFFEIAKAGTEHLVLDLRGNAGGHPIFSAQLFSYLTNRDFIYFKRNEEVKEFEPLYNKMQANKYNFNGKLYVLIDGGCLSTTGHLISLIKNHTNALFIGEEPGSTYCCNDFSIKLPLPNTKIELNIPRTTFTAAVDTTKFPKYFVPDYKVSRPLTDFTSNYDSVYEFVFDLISHP